MYRKAIALAVLIGLAFQCHAQLVTWAWHVSIPGASENGLVLPQLGFDHSGNVYSVFVQPNQVWLRKYSPAENLLFNVQVATTTNPPADVGVFIHVTPNGVNEFEDVVTTTADNVGNEDTSVYRFDPNGNPLFTAPKVFSNITGGDYINDYQFDPAGNAYLRLFDVVGSNAQIKLATIDPSGTVGSTQPIIADFLAYGTSDALVPSSSTHPWIWVIGGFDRTNTLARYTAYDAVSGTVVFTNTLTPPTGDNYNVYANPLPNGEWSLLEDDVNAQTGASTFKIMGMNGLGMTNWTYPATGAASGYIYNVKPGFQSSLYYAGTNNNSNTSIAKYGKLDSNHQVVLDRLIRLNEISLFPSVKQNEFLLTGFAFSTFVEHGNANGDLDWGRSTPSANFVPQVGWFQNAFYILSPLIGPSVSLDRFITGPTLINVSAPSSLASGASSNIIVTLNAPAPAGGMAVELSSYGNLITFPGKGQATVVSIPEGQTTISVPIQAITTSTGGANKGIVIQNGVRWNWTINVSGS